MAYFNPNYQTYDFSAFSTPFPNNPYQNGYAFDLYRQHHAAMMSRGFLSTPGGKATDSKPRLAKDEVDRLEGEFQKNNKPNSSLKKQLAEEMRVDIARINNWFQNRRAKAKQEKRAQENEARRKSEQTTETSTSSETVKEYFNDHDDDLRPSAAPFPPVNVPAGKPSAPQDESSPSDMVETPEIKMEKPQESTEEDDSEHASPDSSFQPQDLGLTYALAADQFYDQSCGFSSSIPSDTANQTPYHLTLSIPNQFMSPVPESTSASSFSSYNQLSGSSGVEGTFGSLSHSLPDNFSEQFQINVKQEGEDKAGSDHFSPESMAHSPPEIATPDFRFKSSSAIDIASRRNSKRPAPLVSGMRSQSYNFPGPKTGIEMSRRMEAPSPMRRVSSATGNFPRGVQKTVGGGPRSPLSWDRSKEALILQMASRSPRSAVAPPTPNTPVVPTQHGMREMTVSSMSSDEDRGYITQTNLTVPQFAMDPTMRTPPDTPGMMTGMPNGLFSAYDYGVSDDPLTTPGFGSFDQEFHQEFPILSSSVPSYVANGCASQPVTPSFPPSSMGPAFYASYSGSNTEYNWSEGCVVLDKPSPDHTRSRQLQFNNMTAQDFHGE
ncbi:Homeobox protein NOBOX [Colletotrichum chlorophyti]|uniref:Homeobox protein NOBOX n=1 Tax=Colletotrichum chlorophyti TaxID=708187 RepID=A0A1Q8S359_9PEZI|nr:Homeobox protein NOBOX [Colletotrichum chlorophyti]